MALTARHAVIKILLQVIQQGRNLPDAFDNTFQDTKESDHSLIQAMSYGVIRFYPRLEFISKQILSKPLKKKDFDIECVILIGLYQLIEMRIPDHAAVSETVKVTKSLKKGWAKNLVNAVLRNYQRQKTAIDNKISHDNSACFAHPHWWISKLQENWPDNAEYNWQHILAANNLNPPMTLRVNTNRISTDQYIALLNDKNIAATACQYSADGITLESAVPVSDLPKFHDGDVSVQDEAAQLAAYLLDAQTGERVLDACAAPGGKTIHILERQPSTQMTALDISAARLEKIQQNLDRTHHQAQLISGDAIDTASWWDGNNFDRILLDAPCSASGVIRRHPDIKLLRRQEDIAALQQLQQQILAALWPLLKTGGMLLYATCSVFHDENDKQIMQFLADNKDAEHLPINDEWATINKGVLAGAQILPGQYGMDGFYYARLVKH